MPWWDDGLVGWLVDSVPYNEYRACKMTWLDDSLVRWWLRCPRTNTVLARCLGGMMGWLVGGFSTFRLILCLQDDLVG
jgi:hypothetical protein